MNLNSEEDGLRELIYSILCLIRYSWCLTVYETSTFVTYRQVIFIFVTLAGLLR